MHDLSSKALARRISVPRDCPEIVLAVAPCRSGTTAQLRVFAQNGIPSFFQPVKALLRQELEGDSIGFVIPDSSAKVFIKETVGPYTEEESTINPLEVLLAAGVPAEKITLITMMREPLSDFTSWVEQFSFGASKEALLENVIHAYQTMDRIDSMAQERGVKRHSVVYEALRDNDPEVLTARLFHRLGLPFAPNSLQDWDRLPAMNSPESGITFPPQSEKYSNTSDHRFHEKVENSSGLVYYPKSSIAIDAAVSPSDVAQLEAGGVFGIFDKARRACSVELQLPVTEPSTLNEFKLRNNFEERRGLPQGKRSTSKEAFY